MNNKINRLFFLVSFYVLTFFIALSIYKEYLQVSKLCTQNAQEMFQEAVHIDMNRRCQEQGEDLKFSYVPVFNQDTIIIKKADTTIYIRNDEAVAEEISDREKIDFVIQYYLSDENPIEVASLDSLFQSLLIQERIPALTAVVYTLNDKSECSTVDSAFFQSATALEEISFGPVRTIVLQAFVKIPFYYVLKQAVFSIGFFILIWIIALVLVLWFTFSRSGRKIHIMPIPEVPKNMIEIAPDLLFDETHGILYSKDQQIELINIRLKLFLVLLEHREYFIDTDKLMDLVWSERNATKDALSTAVKRLKEDLSPIPELVIESARNKGYVLHIRELTI